MDWQLINGVISSAAALALTKVVLDPDVHEGIMIKSGMVAMIFSLLSTGYHMLTKSEDTEAIIRAGAALATGIFFVIFGFFVNTKTHFAFKKLGGKNGAT